MSTSRNMFLTLLLGEWLSCRVAELGNMRYRLPKMLSPPDINFFKECRVQGFSFPILTQIVRITQISTEQHKFTAFTMYTSFTSLHDILYITQAV